MVDGLGAATTSRPASAEELAAALGEAAAAGLAVIPVGGGRALGMGDPPERFDLALETSGMDRLVDYSPADLTVTVEAGMPLEALQAELARAGQFLPLDPFGGPGHTVGGLLASGWSGPLRLRYGTARDYLVGLRVALPDGRLARSGGRVVKNVSGYDLNKLHLGALGSLGVIVEASFKVYPKPLSELSLGWAGPGLEEAWAQADRALSLAMPPVALELLQLGGGLTLVGRIAGTEEGTRRIRRELGWQDADDGFWEEHARHGAERWARLSVRRGALSGLLRMLPEPARWMAQPGVGVAHWFDFEDPDRFVAVRQAAEAEGGSLVLLAAPPDFKRQVGAWGRPPATIDLMRRLRDAFDPRRTLSPGRYLV
ncbi:MAG TPA: FAD-binding protein [Candidatus Dormibacteraeota bacterium]|nr:FAD-binding protein [Candidatus Dormibacteraeota bacterium]